MEEKVIAVNGDVSKVTELLKTVYDSNTRKCVGKFLELPAEDINAIIREYDRRPDARFADSQIYACMVIKGMMVNAQFAGLFNDY